MLKKHHTKPKSKLPMKLTVKWWNLKIERKVKIAAKKRDRLN